MNERRHKGDTATYRELLNYKERVQSFNMAVNLLDEYVRVQIELDATPERTVRDIVEGRIDTIQRVIDRIRRRAQP